MLLAYSTMSKSASTMTTPTPTGENRADLTAESGQLAGLPDIATLARWSNEFFKAAPGNTPPAAQIPSVAPVASVGSVAPIPMVPFTTPFGTEALFAAAAAALPRLSAEDLAHPPLPDVPSHRPPIAPAAGLPEISAIPHFYFLDAPATPSVPRGSGRSAFDVNAIRRDFPILTTRVHGRPLVWFDNAATTQKPNVVIERLAYFYRNENSNIHRAAHELAARATDAYENARRQAQRFLGAASPDEIIYVRGATEAINLVAQSWGRKHIGPGDEILISHLEHHANIVPWQLLVNERGAKLKVVPVDSSGQLRMDELQRLLTDRTKLVSITHVSNALGTITPAREIVDLAHRAGALALVDGAQSVSHMPIDVQALGADFFVLSGHKIFGPTGIGILYGRSQVLEDMPPWQGGGNMIEDVTFESTRYQGAPVRFEAGTGNIADAVGLGAAFEYLGTVGMHAIEQYEAQLLAYATERIQTVPGLQIVGTAAHKASVVSFVIDGHDPATVGSALNQEGIAVRAGHHCAQPILRRFGHEATVRASLAFYNTCEEVDRLAAALRRLVASAGR
jgi:cysteine desulfurase / selenocysteine lyase